MSDTVRRLPWGAERHIHSTFTIEPTSSLDSTIKPGEYTLHVLLNQFFIAAEARIADVCSETKQHLPLNQCLKRGDDVHFDQVLDVFQAISEHSLPSLVRIAFEWFRHHINEDQLKLRATKSTTSGIKENDWLEERRQLTVHFIFCLILIDVLKQLSFHAGFDVSSIEDQAFRWFRGNEKFNDITSTQPNQVNYQTVCDLYAEVVGVLAHSRFLSVKRRFMLELNNLRKEPASPSVNANIISLNTGMRFFRVKMTPVEDFEACFQFLLDLANYFLEVRERDIKNSLANLFVEILLPVAAVVKLEINIPIVRNFVDLLYSHVFDLCSKNKHRLAMFPLMTCLLCITQRQVFFTHWNKFMLLCLGNLRGEAKLARISLESLYRLIWVYMVRFKGENVKTTNQHLTCIVNSLFPKSFKAVTPKDIPLNIFVKIIHFISQEKLDFAMKDIIFDLLSVGRCRNLMPERMNVGLRAFLVIADSLAQNEEEPMMPLHNMTFPSGHTLRPRRTCTKMISDSIVKEIGLQNYFEPIRKTFDAILKMLDTQVGRCLLVTRPDNANKDTEDLLSGDRKPKIDLLRTCIAALPRLLPLGTSQEELIEMLARLTIHMDHELAVQAFQSLQYFVIELPEWRKSVFRGFTNFIIREVTDQLMFLSDTGKTTLDHSMRFLLQLLQQWKHVLINSTSKQNLASNISQQTDMETLAMAEGFGIIALCQTHHNRRKYGVMILREVKNIAIASKCLQPNQVCLIDVLDAAVPTVIEKITSSLTLQEKANLLCNSTADLSWLVDRSVIWDTQEETKSIPTVPDVNGSTNILQSTTSLSVLNPNPSNVSPSTTITTTPSLTILPQVQQNQQSQSQLSLSLPSCLLQSTNNLLLSSQIMAATNSNASTTTLASTTTQNATNNNNILSTSLTSNELNARFDMWTECLAELFVYKNILKCPLTRIEAWRMVFFRLTQLFPYVDPNSATTEIRSSFVFRSTDILKKANEREYNLNLWKNYLICACCLTISGTEKFQQSNVDTSVYLETHQDSSKFYTPASNTAVSLFRIVVNLLRCETSDMREIVIRGLGRTNPEAFKDLLEDLSVHIKDAMEVKQEKVRRMKKRDYMRLRLVRIFELLADREVFQYCYLNETEVKRSSYQIYHEYLQGGLSYLDLENEKDSDLIQQIRQYFARFIYKFINQIPHHIRETIIPPQIRYSLFELFRKWSGNLNIMTVFASTREQQMKSEPCSELELIAIRACAATLCCGTIKDEWFQKTVVPWLDQFMAAHETSQLSVTTLYQLLELHGKTTNTMVVEWVIDRCYTKSVRFSDRCFTALAKVFIEVSNDYPCDLPSVLTLTLSNVGSPRMHVHELALRLMVVLCRGHLSESQPTSNQQSNGISSSDDIAYIISLASNYSKSQMMLCEYLARRRPDLTMAMFSEITTRILTANSSSRGTLFMILLPWIHNIELVDPSLPKSVNGHDITLNEEQGNAFLQGTGWGSVQSTELVLNNLFYLTAIFSSEHAPELELLWNALTGTWSHNLKVILRYMLIMITLSPCELLPYAKKIILYMCKHHEERLLNELLNELQITESLNISLERTDTLPFFRSTNSSTTLSNTNNNSSTQLSGTNSVRKLANTHESRGFIHTKRHHSGEDHPQHDHNSHMNTLKIRSPSQNSLSTSFSEKLTADIDKDYSTMIRLDEGLQVAPLPLAPYGGIAAPLKTLLPNLSIPIPCLFRCSIAVMLINELIVSGLQIDWSAHLPQLLHVAMLGMDHNRAIVYEHCKSLVFNLLLALSVQSEQIWLSEKLLSHVDWDNSKLSTKIRQERDTNGININSQSLFADSLNENFLSSNNEILTETNSSSSLSREQIVQSLITYLNTKKGCPLWAYEDITAQVHTIRSALQLTQFIQWIVILFRTCVPQAMLEERWMELALRITLSCSSRHYAGRSLQIIRALSLPLNFRWVIDILSRLVETVAEHNDDMQGYVTEILLTLTYNIDAIHKQISGSLSTSISQSKESLSHHPINPVMLSNKIEAIQTNSTLPSDRRDKRKFRRQSGERLSIVVTNSGMATAPTSPRNLNSAILTDGHSTTTICPSISTTNGFLLQPDDQQQKVLLRLSPESDRSCTSTTSTLTRSRSEHNVRQQNPFSLTNNNSNTNNNNNHPISTTTNDVQTLAASIDDAKTVLAQLFWIGICLLESDYEYEFTLAIQLLTTIIDKIQLNTYDYIDRMMNILKTIKWHQFPGVQSLVFKGCTSSITFESTMILTSCLTNILTLPFISMNKPSLAMNVIALLPYMMYNYDNQHVVCIQAADRIARVCHEHDDSEKLTNLATVMSLYAQGKFTSTASQWAKCVLKYLTDVYIQDSINWIRFLCEILDNGPNYLQTSILDIFHHLVTLIDTKSLNDYASFNNELVRTLCKYVNKTEYCNEITKTLKLLIQRSSTLSTPKHITSNNLYNTAPLSSLMGEVHFFDSHKSSIELPGRTLDIDYNLSQMMNAIKTKDQQNHNALKFFSSSSTMNSRRRHTYVGATIGTSEMDVNSWKQNAAQSQKRTRERLTALMVACGKQAGLSRLPLNRSASVVFSQTSDLAEQPPMGSSLPSSSKESMTSENVDQTFISKQFDFLNDEDSIHEMFPITTDAHDFGDEDDGPMTSFDDAQIQVDHEHRRNSVGNTLRNLSTVGEWFDPYRLKSKIRGKLPSFGSSSSGRKITSRKHSANEFTHMTDVVVDTSRHIDEFTSAMDASTTTATSISTAPTTGRERTGASVHSLRCSYIVDRLEPAKVKRRAPTKSWTPWSREDMMPDLAVSHNHHPTGLLHVVTMNNEYIEDAWQTHARNLIDEINPSDSVKTFLLFRRLFKDIRRRLSIFVQETCHCLSWDNRFRHIVSQFFDMLNELMLNLYCNLVFVDENIMNINPLLIKHRLIITELNENYGNYMSKKALAIDCLDSIKANLKLQSLGERGYDTFASNEQKLHMCKHLYNLFFQVITLAESYSKLISNLCSITRDSTMNIRNLSSEFTAAYNGLNDFLNDLRSGKEDPPTIETNNLPNRDTAIAYIFQCLHSNTYSNAIKYLRSARSLWPDDFGDEHNEIDVALTILYESLKKTHTTANLLVILQQGRPIADVCHRLYEQNLKILSSTPDSLQNSV